MLAVHDDAVTVIVLKVTETAVIVVPVTTNWYDAPTTAFAQVHSVPVVSAGSATVVLEVTVKVLV